MLPGNLFDSQPVHMSCEPIGIDAMVLRGFACEAAAGLLETVACIAQAAPFHHIPTPNGHRTSVAMTNCGRFGWVSDRGGYRYAPLDPFSGKPWPPTPAHFQQLAVRAAAQAGFDGFDPDAVLINRYQPGMRLSLHQDKDERNKQAPIVSVSLGVPAIFLWGGLRRAERTRRVLLEHGDVVVWGGASRFVFHGVAPLKEQHHCLTGSSRINLTFRCTGLTQQHTLNCRE